MANPPPHPMALSNQRSDLNIFSTVETATIRDFCRGILLVQCEASRGCGLNLQPIGDSVSTSKTTRDSLFLLNELHRREDMSPAEIRALLGLGQHDRAQRARRILEDLGFVERLGDGRSTRYRLSISARQGTEHDNLTETDLTALMLGQRVLSYLQGPQDEPLSEELLRRLARLAHPRSVQEARAFAERLVLVPDERMQRDADAINEILTAVRHHHELDLALPDGQLMGFRCHAVVMHDRSFFLVGENGVPEELIQLPLGDIRVLARHRKRHFTPRDREWVRDHIEQQFDTVVTAGG